jgi:hypothetical protein
MYLNCRLEKDWLSLPAQAPLHLRDRFTVQLHWVAQSQCEQPLGHSPMHPIQLSFLASSSHEIKVSTRKRVGKMS